MKDQYMPQNLHEDGQNAALCIAEQLAPSGVEHVTEAAKIKVDASEAGKYKSLNRWAQSSYGKRMLKQGVIDLGVIDDPDNWKRAKQELADEMSGIFDAGHPTVTIIDPGLVLRRAGVTISMLGKETIEVLGWGWNQASMASFEKGDESEGEALSMAANALKAARLDAIAKPSRTTDEAVWIFKMNPPVARILKSTGVKSS